MTELKIERRGGLGGFGLPGSRVKSEGRLALDRLSGDDRRKVEQLFEARAAAVSPHADGFVYRITRRTAQGEETIEVPEAEVPAALVQSVRDELI
jgi:hypothetical protein